MKSPFRPDDGPDASALDLHRPLIRSLERRGLLRGGLTLGSLVMLTGCDVKRPEAVEHALLAISRLNDRVQALLFDPNKLAHTYPASMVLRPPKFNAYYDVIDVKPVNGANWRLELGGLIQDKRPWTLQDLQGLPQSSIAIKHICVEGWSYLGGWTGVRLWTFLERVGADLRAPYVAFKTADSYPSSIDMASALHPQTSLALQYGGQTLADPFGFPMRLRTAVKLGYKNPKWVTAIEVTKTYPGGFRTPKASHGSREPRTS
jgi:DMSO/TMAO reductase YedYZ molybdopterin-dependent catalytic subunit